jgi:hypothetical protein
MAERLGDQLLDRGSDLWPELDLRLTPGQTGRKEDQSCARKVERRVSLHDILQVLLRQRSYARAVAGTLLPGNAVSSGRCSS